MVPAHEDGVAEAELADPLAHPSRVVELVGVIAAEQEEPGVRAPPEHGPGRLDQLHLPLGGVEAPHQDHDGAAGTDEPSDQLPPGRAVSLDRGQPVVHYAHALAEAAAERAGHGRAHTHHLGAATGHQGGQRPVPREVVLDPDHGRVRPRERCDEGGLHPVRVDDRGWIAAEEPADASS